MYPEWAECELGIGYPAGLVLPVVFAPKCRWNSSKARAVRAVFRELDWHSSCGNRFIVRSVLVDRAAELLGVSRRTVYYRIREGELQTFRTRGGSQRVLLDSIERLLREGKKARRTRRRRVESLDLPPLGICNGEDAAGRTLAYDGRGQSTRGVFYLRLALTMSAKRKARSSLLSESAHFQAVS